MGDTVSMAMVMLRTLAACALGALVLAGAAGATPPTIVTVGASNGVVSVTWTLPPSGVAWSIEIARSNDVDAQGYFLTDNVVDTAVVPNQSTSWTGTPQLDPGTYYVHISGQDTSCSTCPIPEWSTIKTLTIGGTSSSTGTTTTTPTSTSPTSTSPTATSTSPTATSPTTTTPSQTTTKPTTTSPTSTTPAVPTGPNKAPRIAGIDVFRAAGRTDATVRVCDDRAGMVALRVTARKRHAARTVNRRVDVAAPGCWPYLVALRVPRGSGRVTLSARAEDAAGARSRTFVGGT